ncbi:uncharacterized protein LOC134290030 [Aedes albopictus]|uniref:PHD-type domain-containing protein n=1 Tax=Aedes albopictus TaxID=7160 RepID=A0ABM1ZW20_AEDAL
MSDKATTDRHCSICEQPDNQAPMIECARCHTRYHNSCAGAQDGTSATSSPYYCEMCVPRCPAPSVSSSASTSASARARLQIQMQKLAEEKRLQERLIAEREKAIAEKIELEKVYITRKYDLLLAQAEVEEECKSVRSRRSSRRSIAKVQSWIDNQPATLTTNSGETIPTGITSQQSSSSNQGPSLHSRNPPQPREQQPVETANVIGAPKDQSIGAAIQPSSSMVDSVSSFAISNNAPASSAAVLIPACQSTPFVASSAANVQRSQPDDVDADQEEDYHNRTYSVQIDRSISTGNPLEAEQSLYTGSAPVSTPTRHVRIAADTNAASRAPDVGGIIQSKSNPIEQLFDISSYTAGRAYPIAHETLSNQHRAIGNKTIFPTVTPPHPTNTAPMRSVSSYPGPIFSLPMGSSAPPFPSTTNVQPFASDSVLPRSTSALPISATGVPVTVYASISEQPVHSSPFIGNRYHSGTISSAPIINSRLGQPANPLPIGSAPVNPIGIPAASAIFPGAVSAAPASVPGFNYSPYPQAVQGGPGHPVSSASYDAQLFNAPTAQQLAARHVVPKELPPFSGNPAEWPLFWSSFETSTRICGYSDAENLMRLQRCLKGEARKAVNCFLLHPLNVQEILRTLCTLYGRPEAIIGTLLAEVRATPAPRSEKLETVINFGLAVRNLCAHLIATGQEMHLANPMLINELVDKLPANIKLDWALYTQRVARADLRAFSEYMNVIVDAASRVTPVMNKPEKSKERAVVNAHASESYASKSRGEQKPSTTKTSYTNPPVGASDKPCLVCKTSGHKPKDCSSFQSKSLENRWKIAQELHLCRRCLYPHGKWPCKASLCGADGCEQRHHKLLHPGDPREERESTASSSAVTGVVTVHQNWHNKVLFRIIPVMLHANGRSVQTFAFLDGGSDSTLVEKSLVDQLGVEGSVSPLCMQWTNGVKRTEEDSRRVQFNISGVGQGKQFQLRGVQTVESLDLPHQSIRFEELEGRFAHLRGLPVVSYRDGVPGILIGLDNTKVKTSLKQREGKANEPIATKTRLGWVVFGRTGTLDQAQPNRVLHVCTRSHDDDLNELVKQFFSTESVGVSAAKVTESADDQRARDILESTTVRTPSGKYQTGLLWRYDAVEFPNSRPMAERRLKCLEHRLTKSPELYEKMRQLMVDYQTKGYAHKATQRELEESDPKRVWYLPLGVVVNPRKPDKLRVVWDAAAAVQGVSFNSVLLEGPDLLVPLQTVLCRYRQRNIAISADIMEMFHQVQIRPEDRQSQRFLWRDNPAQLVQVFVMDVAIFGSTCSPCSTQYAKNVNADDHAEEFPRAAVAIKENHYVDDYLDSVDSVDEAVQLATDV